MLAQKSRRLLLYQTPESLWANFCGSITGVTQVEKNMDGQIRHFPKECN
jgi:hypothetical protein